MEQCIYVLPDQNWSFFFYKHLWYYSSSLNQVSIMYNQYMKSKTGISSLCRRNSRAGSKTTEKCLHHLSQNIFLLQNIEATMSYAFHVSARIYMREGRRTTQCAKPPHGDCDWKGKQSSVTRSAHVPGAEPAPETDCRRSQRKWHLRWERWVGEPVIGGAARQGAANSQAGCREV